MADYKVQNKLVHSPPERPSRAGVHQFFCIMKRGLLMRKSPNKGIIFENEVAEKLKGMVFDHVKETKRSRECGADILAFRIPL
ncbi:MAG: hypothetical protein SCARUB_04399 [Candidatus Scalindua rubra]|uniref:Uncharacterized protein n=1 Tax=Candidatus Scalindua rubra TaxID=1872076 RepID=A0A1E3X4E0_9BACT|nr:MAG: hypothetical protein SCARUB_04399 [Candidatus Scalindua rubra]